MKPGAILLLIALLAQIPVAAAQSYLSVTVSDRARFFEESYKGKTAGEQRTSVHLLRRYKDRVKAAAWSDDGKLLLYVLDNGKKHDDMAEIACNQIKLQKINRADIVVTIYDFVQFMYFNNLVEFVRKSCP